MKIIISIIFAISSINLFGQRVRPTDTIEIALNKTTYIHLNGPQKPYTVHVGGIAGNVYYDSIAASNGVVWVRAGKDNVPESNMIIAAQDTVLLFVLKYNKDTKNTLWMYDIAPKGKQIISKVDKVVKGEEKKTEGKKIKEYDNMAVYKLNPYINTSTSSNGMQLKLENIATDSTNIFYKITLSNKSKVDFEIDGEFCMLKTKTKNNRKSVAGIETPITITGDSGNEKIIPAKAQFTFIYKTPLTPIRNDEFIVLSILEKTSLTKGRTLSLTINPYIFYKMQTIK